MEKSMHQNPIPSVAPNSNSDVSLRRMLAAMSVFTLLMSIPQALTIWVGHRAEGVSTLTWSTYFASAVLWFWFGLRKHDKNIYLPCIGWIIVDTFIVVGAFQSCVVGCSRRSVVMTSAGRYVVTLPMSRRRNDSGRLLIYPANPRLIFGVLLIVDREIRSFFIWKLE
jgi:uncharacterized protein with PQ loop repeat